MSLKFNYLCWLLKRLRLVFLLWCFLGRMDIFELFLRAICVFSLLSAVFHTLVNAVASDDHKSCACHAEEHNSEHFIN